MHRASKQALEKAANMDLKILEWKGRKIIFIDPREKLKKRVVSGLKIIRWLTIQRFRKFRITKILNIKCCDVKS